MKRIALHTLILVFFTGVLSSCSLLSYLGEMMCTLAPDTDHCAQFVAIQSNSPAACENIKGTKFAEGGSNPPRDKCYLTLAENNSDPSLCSNIKGGLMSYTQDECIGSVSQKILDESVAADDINGCMKLSKLPSAYQDKFTECKEKIATVEKMTTKDTNIDDVIAQLKSDPNNPELKKQLDDLKTQKQAMFEMMGGTQQGQYLQKKREEIMEGIEDEDVKSAIAKEFTPYRQNETNINNMLDKLQEVTEKQKRIKSADEKANELVDKLKEQLDGIVQEKQDEIVGAMGDKAVEWIQENGGKDLNYALNDMKWAMEKYEKGSKMYEDAKAKYDKIKKVYDEVMGVYNRVDEVNKLLAQGKIDKGKAEVLKGAILLDKGLEYATGYVPVFGSTISTISKETFGTVIEFAKKRAQRTTSIDKCIEDPENCDPNGISAY